MQIVIAWSEREQVVDRSKPYAADLGQRPKFKDVIVAKAAMWLNEGTSADLEKAQAYAYKNGHKVFTFTGEPDPLGAARKKILE